MSPKVYVVIGKNFGDEGKGRVVDALAGVAPSQSAVISKCECDIKDAAPGRCLVIRHNGGAQSGHTVIRRLSQDSSAIGGEGPETTSGENPEMTGGEAGEARFVFHELGAGSFTGADTLWADTFFPDLYKLNEEFAAFHELSGIESSIFSMGKAPITTVDDVLLNMALEKSRGAERHGSCGMGIYEAYLRTEAGYGITVADVKRGGPGELFELLKRNRREYVIPRIKRLSARAVGLQDAARAVGLQDAAHAEDLQGGTNHEEYYLDPDKCSEIIELLEDDNVLWNAAEEMCDGAKKVTLADSDVKSFLRGYERVIFETGQGLLLDSENREYAPHVTGSRTGLTNPAAFAERFGLEIDEVVYVTRTYVTRHGAGLLKHECSREELGIKNPDSTNVTNEWQGDFRYAPHASIGEFLEAPLRDLAETHIAPLRDLEETHIEPLRDLEGLQTAKCLDRKLRGESMGLSQHHPKVSLAVTHLSDTGDCILFFDSSKDGNFQKTDIKEFQENPAVKEVFSSFYLYD